ncbi:MAG: hypothetical protein GC156_13975 [Actinomycetales bacterium]|nr:hypothetical protein [Actinomycetales bacterium]
MARRAGRPASERRASGRRDPVAHGPGGRARGRAGAQRGADPRGWGRPTVADRGRGGEVRRRHHRGPVPRRGQCARAETARRVLECRRAFRCRTGRFRVPTGRIGSGRRGGAGGPRGTAGRAPGDRPDAGGPAPHRRGVRRAARRGSDRVADRLRLRASLPGSGGGADPARPVVDGPHRDLRGAAAVMALSAALWSAAAWMWLGPPAERRSLFRGHGAGRGRDGPRAVGRHRVLAGAVAGVAVTLVLGWPLGPPVGLACLVLLPRWLGRLEPMVTRRRREALERQAPLLADLLAATLAAGAGTRAAVHAVAEAFDEPGAAALRPVVIALDLGADVPEAWRLVDDGGAWSSIVESVVRATTTGAPLASTLAAVANDLRRERRRAVDVAARAAGVRAVGPLAACFLPAFLLLGVVPVVVSLASAVTGLG